MSQIRRLMAETINHELITINQCRSRSKAEIRRLLAESRRRMAETMNYKP